MFQMPQVGLEKSYPFTGSWDMSRCALRLPTWPRLVGTTSKREIVAWSSWRVVNTTNTLEVLPGTNRPISRLFAVLGAVSLIVTAVVVYKFYSVPPIRARAIFGVVLSLQFLVMALIAREIGVRERAKGPILIVALEPRTLTLPREPVAWSFDNVVSIDVIVGRYRRGAGRFDKPHRFPSGSTELQIVVCDADGLLAVPIVGDSNRFSQSVADLAKLLSDRLNRPLTRINDDDRSSEI